MATHLLVDSCSYFRLARVIEPLLGAEFGEPPFDILVVPELDEEFGKSPNLQVKFPWVNEQVYKNNRVANVLAPNCSAFDLRETTKFFKDHKYTKGLGVSKVDIRVLVVAYLSSATVISDDKDVQEMAKDFGMSECMTSLEVLVWFFEEEILTLKEVKTIVRGWKAEKDLPMPPSKFVDAFYDYFGVNPW